jgi:hypothetical protein
VSVFDQSWDLIKATVDEAAYARFKQLMSRHGGFPGSNEGLYRELEDGRYVDRNDGEMYAPILDDEGYVDYDYHPTEGEPLGKVPVDIGRGYEHIVYSIPALDQYRPSQYVAKVPIPKSGQPDHVRRQKEYSAPEGITRAPIEAFWSKVMGNSEPIVPYSVFSSGDTLDLVQRDLRHYSPFVKPMDQRMGHILDLRDTPYDDEDFISMFDDWSPTRSMTQQGLADQEIRGYDDEDYHQQGDLSDEQIGEEGHRLGSGNVDVDGLIYDYASLRPFQNDERKLLTQDRIDRILEDTIREQKRVPKRYRQYSPDLDQNIRQLISELQESSKKGRMIGSSISFRDARHDVEL